MPTDPRGRECPQCRGTKLMEGRSGGKITSFVPAGRFMWVGYKTLSFLCLDCGFVGQQLSAAQVAEIKQKHAGL